MYINYWAERERLNTCSFYSLTAYVRNMKGFALFICIHVAL